jgi:hypothetical protein
MAAIVGLLREAGVDAAAIGATKVGMDVDGGVIVACAEEDADVVVEMIDEVADEIDVVADDPTVALCLNPLMEALGSMAAVFANTDGGEDATAVGSDGAADDGACAIGIPFLTTR